MIENSDAWTSKYGREYAPVPSSYRKDLSERIRRSFIHTAINGNPSASHLASCVLKSDIYFTNIDVEELINKDLIVPPSIVRRSPIPQTSV
jgi:hypothetical protein